MTELLVPPDPEPEPVRQALCDWLMKHGIDPNHVCAHGWIERDAEARQIRCEVYDRKDGAYYLVDDQPARAVLVVQLEAPPLPFPEGTHAYWAGA